MRKIALVLAIAALFCAGQVRASEPLKVVASFSILADMAKQVGGDDVVVTSLVGPDGDVHAYKPLPSDAKKLAAADIVIVNGLGLEGWVDRLIVASGFKGRKLVVSEGIVARDAGHEEGEDAHDHHHEGKDPHAWQDIANGRHYAAAMAAAFKAARPEHAAAIEARAKAYDAELQKLDAWVKSEINAVPLAKRKIVTSHDAFGYFGDAYGVSFIAAQGMNTESEPTATQVAKLVRQVKAEKVKRVFFESMASPRLIERLAKDAQAEVGAPVYSDALSAPGGGADTYTAMFKHNVLAFIEAMRLTAP